jgi:hypothetical protein
MMTTVVASAFRKKINVSFSTSNRDAHGDDCRRFCFPQEDKRVVLYNWPQAGFDNTGLWRGAH